MLLVVFQTIQFRLRTQSMSEQFYFKQFSLAYVHSLIVKNISI